jgi:hypothetical protein
MTTSQTIEAWSDADFRHSLQDLVEVLPIASRCITRARAAVFLSWLPPGRSGEWYWDQIVGHLVVASPAGQVERVAMGPDPACPAQGRHPLRVTPGDIEAWSRRKK